MTRWIPLAVLAVLAACDAPQAPLETGSDGQTLIRIVDPMTCYDRRCLKIDTANRRVQSVGNRWARIPGEISVSDGTITPDEFRRLGQVASLAGGMGSRGDR